MKKAKTPVVLRFKSLQNGSKSLYLDIYTDGARRYEFLKLYLIPEKTPFDKVQNKNTLQAANAIVARRVMDLANERAGIKPKRVCRLTLADWAREYTGSRIDSGYKSAGTLVRTRDLVCEFAQGARLVDVDADFCERFARWLRARGLKDSTAAGYFAKFSTMLTEAVRRGLIEKNPCGSMSRESRIKAGTGARCYLTLAEVAQIESTPHRNETAKRAFLFSCFTGLRISDILALRWADIKTDGGAAFIEIEQQKTGQFLRVPLTGRAQGYLPPCRCGERVFVIERSTLQKSVKRLARRAGINKNVSFHTARHTFATGLLTAGADIYTTSKLLGHTNVSTTQIYAKIVDAKRVDAVNMLESAFESAQKSEGVRDE